MIPYELQETCRAVVRNTDPERTARARLMAKQSWVYTLDQMLSENRGAIVTLEYEKFFDLQTKTFTWDSHRLALFQDGTASCSCLDSTNRRSVICKHSCLAAALIIVDSQREATHGN